MTTTTSPWAARYSAAEIDRRALLIGATSAAAGLAAQAGWSRETKAAEAWDLIIVGAGTAGLPAAIFAARRGAKVLIIEASLQIGGTLFLSTGQMSAAGTRLQKEKGIQDSAQLHFDDVLRISRRTVRPELVRLAVDNAAVTFDWLMDNGLKPLPEHPILGAAHEPYSVKRYAWGPENGISILEAIEPLVLAEEKKGGVSIKRGLRAREFLQRSGAVTGVRAENDAGQMLDFEGRTVLLASGGYASNPKMFYELSGYKQYGNASYPYSQGDGYTMALAVGGFTRGKEHYICGSPRIMASTDEPAVPETRWILFPERRPPWEIQVNARGQRYVAEDNPSVDEREKALVLQPDLRTWLVFDQAILDAAPLGIEGWDRARLLEAFNSHPVFYKADTLAELAAKSGVDAKGLQDTVARYNAAQAKGVDPDFARKHMPLPIGKGPFYAVRQQGMSVSSTVGIGVDEKLRVIRADGSPITGLYAAGEILGSGQLMGKSAVGGMMVTPALTFGRLLGQSMLPLKA